MYSAVYLPSPLSPPFVASVIVSSLPLHAAPSVAPVVNLIAIPFAAAPFSVPALIVNSVPPILPVHSAAAAAVVSVPYLKVISAPSTTLLPVVSANVTLPIEEPVAIVASFTMLSAAYSKGVSIHRIYT